jgi:hypothetical protein
VVSVADLLPAPLPVFGLNVSSTANRGEMKVDNEHAGSLMLVDYLLQRACAGGMRVRIQKVFCHQVYNIGLCEFEPC